MWWKRLSRSAFLGALLVFIGANSPAVANEIRLVIDFDKGGICCIMNQDAIAGKLEEVDGINVASFNLTKRRIIIYYESEKLTVQAIVDSISEITTVDKKLILPQS